MMGGAAACREEIQKASSSIPSWQGENPGPCGDLLKKNPLPTSKIFPGEKCSMMLGVTEREGQVPLRRKGGRPFADEMRELSRSRKATPDK